MIAFIVEDYDVDILLNHETESFLFGNQSLFCSDTVDGPKLKGRIFDAFDLSYTV